MNGLASAKKGPVSMALPLASAGHPLSCRQTDVLALVATGRTDAEIAATLFLSRRTVTTHLTTIYRRLGVANRAEAAAWLVRQGLA